MVWDGVGQVILTLDSKKEYLQISDNPGMLNVFLSLKNRAYLDIFC